MKASTARKRLGTHLLEKGLISPEHLRQALEEQKLTGSLIGKILSAKGACTPFELAKNLAEHQGVPFVDLLTSPPDIRLLDPARMADYLALEAVPWHREDDGCVIVACTAIHEKLQSWVAEHYGERHRFAITSPRDIHRSLTALFPDYFLKQGLHRLWQLAPHFSARRMIRLSHKLILLGTLLLLCGIWATFPSTLSIILLLLANLFYFATLAFKTILFVTGKRHRQTLWHARESFAESFAAEESESALPIYTVLVPLYDEARSLPGLLQALRALDYPASKLDIKLIIEADDRETMEAAKTLKPEGRFEIVLVPYALPRTKPKACNYALRFAKGEFVTIYDAEDRPDPMQLKRAVRLFRSGPPDLVCIQCRLNYYNRERNLLTRLFALEYAAWFDFMLPGLDHLGLPVPLGGTSNHIALARLAELGEWDPYNVTEDADLGIRMALRGYRTFTLDSETLEEAPPALWSWIKQRTRWIKGYMQTWLVHMRQPRLLWRQLGPRGFLGFQLFIGGPSLVFLSTPVLLIFSAYWLLTPNPDQHFLLAWIFPIGFANFAYGLALHLNFGLEVQRDRSWPGMRSAIAAFPFYWLLHSAASFRALYQLLTRPHHWDKTAHGEESPAPA